MRYGSVCSGIEAASVAWHPLGWQAAFFSEIEPFPRAVLAHRFPEVPLHGDFTTIGADDYGPIDVLVGGTPCQSFSVAGLRGGLDDERGNLALEYLRLADRKRPRWLVWENVPGVLSSNGGRDFGSILGGMVELGYGIAYRVLDAQHFGIPQRRRRVFVVGYLGDWRRAAAVLFERHSLSGHPAPRREARKEFASGVAPSTGDISHCLNAGGMGRQDYETKTLIAHTLRGEGFDASEDGTGRGTPLVPVAFALGSHAGAADGDQTNRSHGGGGPVGSGISEEVSYSLRAGRTQSVAVAFHPTQDPISSEDVSHAMGAGSKAGCATVVVAFTQNQRDEVRTLEVAGALAAEPGAKQQTYLALSSQDHIHAHAEKAGPRETLRPLAEQRSGEPRAPVPGMPHQGAPASAVRRLTPKEAERLQGFPDGWTDIPWRGKPHAPDGPRYKALGNSMAVPVMRWIGQRIAMVDAIPLAEAAE